MASFTTSWLLRLQLNCIWFSDYCTELHSDLAVALCPCRMMVFGVLTLVLSWSSLGADLATAVVSCFAFSALTDWLTPIWNLHKLLCSHFLSCQTVMINSFIYTHTALEKCLSMCTGKGDETIVHTWAYVYISVCEWIHFKNLQCAITKRMGNDCQSNHITICFC